MVFALVAAASAKAQTLDGRVRVTETLTPLRGALLVLISDSSNTMADSTRVDSAGVFYLNASAPGRYRVEIHNPEVLKEAMFIAPPVVLMSDSTVQRDYLVPLADLLLNEHQVERPAAPKGITLRPKYPTELEKQQIEGEVLAQYIVDQEGRVATSSIKIIRATRPEFADAVRETIRRTQFNPAQIGGRAVSQCATQLFQFAMGSH